MSLRRVKPNPKHVIVIPSAERGFVIPEGTTREQATLGLGKIARLAREARLGETVEPGCCKGVG